MALYGDMIFAPQTCVDTWRLPFVVVTIGKWHWHLVHRGQECLLSSTAPNNRTAGPEWQQWMLRLSSLEERRPKGVA